MMMADLNVIEPCGFNPYGICIKLGQIEDDILVEY